MHYVAFIHKDPGTSYGVTFPDFPGCVTVGDTADEALRNAAEALALHVSGMKADSEDVPPPRSIDEILADPELVEDREGVTFAFVRLVRG